MLEIEMSKDIKDYEPNLIGPLTARQIICVTIAVAYGIPLFMAMDIDIVARIMITFFAMVPMVLCGWIKIYNMPLESFLKMMIVSKFIKPQKRVYEIGDDLKIESSRPVYKKVKRSKNVKGYR